MFSKIMLLLFAFVCLSIANLEAGEQPAQLTTETTVSNHTIPIPPTRGAPLTGKGHIGRECINHCSGLCRQLCYKFKALKVCNGCVRGCLHRCDNGELTPVEYNPYKHPKPELTLQQ